MEYSHYPWMARLAPSWLEAAAPATAHTTALLEKVDLGSSVTVGLDCPTSKTADSNLNLYEPIPLTTQLPDGEKPGLSNIIFYNSISFLLAVNPCHFCSCVPFRTRTYAGPKGPLKIVYSRPRYAIKQQSYRYIDGFWCMLATSMPSLRKAR